MAVQWRSTRVSYSFSRVLFLAYLLSANPSAAVVIPKECLDIATVAEGYATGKGWAKFTQCVTLFFKQNPELAKEFQEIPHTIKDLVEMVGKVDPIKAGVFAALALSLYLTAQAFELSYTKLPQHLENVKHYREELRLLYSWKIVPVLKDIDDLMVNWQDYEVERVTNVLLATLKEISEKLADFHREIENEKVKVIENERRAVAVGGVIVAVGFGLWVTAFAFSPAIIRVVLVVAPCVVIFAITPRNDFDELKKELKELQDKIYKYKDQIANGESKVRNILTESYRNVKPRSNRG